MLLTVAISSIRNNCIGQPPTYIWAKTLPGNVQSIQRTILTDVSGNVYISGVFWGTVDFDPGVGTANKGLLNKADQIPFSSLLFIIL